jgi:L-asparaginase / beta-aspartyl-peptidase
MGKAIVVHGGAGTIASARHAAAKLGCREAALAGWAVLAAGGSALDAVVAAVTTLEDNPGFNAGTGSVLTRDGHTECDAGIMNGKTLEAGAIAGVEHIKNPIQLARLVLSSQHVLLIGSGAEEFAVESGMTLCAPDALVTDDQRERWRKGYREGDEVHAGPVDDGILPEEHVHADGTDHGTVGAVALDESGLIVAGTSTGGFGAKHPGRVGDTPLLGAGFYAENPYGGASCTGRGEHFIRLLLAKRAVDFISQGMSAQQAAEAAIAVLTARTPGRGGLIVLSERGDIGVAHSSPSIAWASMCDGTDEPATGITAMSL